MTTRTVTFVAIAIFFSATRASAQTFSDVLTFLLTNRTVATDDFARDQLAAKAASDAVSELLLVDLNTLPLTTSAGGFTYRFDPTLGVRVRSSDSFDPFFTQRALTPGAQQITFGLSYQQSAFHTIDGRNLRDGSLISTGSRLTGQTDVFDAESLTMRLQVNTATLVANGGVTDRLEVGAALPLVRVTLDGQRIDTYRGRASLQASANAVTSGPGDVLVHAKYELLREPTRGVAIGVEGRLPTGDTKNLLGTGKKSGGPLLIASIGDERASVHGNLGFSAGGLSNSLDYRAAGIFAASSRLTLIGELIGNRLGSVGRLTEVVAPNPTLVDVETVRLTSTDQAISRLVTVAGVRWNFRSTWLVSANVVHPLTNGGLNDPWIPTVTLDHSFGQ